MNEKEAQDRRGSGAMTEREAHAGIIHVSSGVWNKMLGDVLKIDATDIQGVLRDKGIFAEVRKRLLLPESYQIRAIFFKWFTGTWSVVVEGPDLPRVVEDMGYPQVTPIYQRNEDGSTSLVRIDI
jgi:hypothetical protein